MPRLDAHALSLRVIGFSESSQILSLLTRTHGRVSVLAKGSCRPKSPFGGPFDLLQLDRVSLSRRAGSYGLWTLRSREQLELFRPFRHSLPRYFAALMVVEYLRAWTIDEDPALRLFDVAVEVLHRLAYQPVRVMELLWFELNGLRLQGHLPELNECVECRQRRPARGFSLIQGGRLCADCLPADPQALSPRPGSIDLLRTISHQPLNRMADLRAPEATLVGCRLLMDGWHQAIFQHPLRMPHYLVWEA